MGLSGEIVGRASPTGVDPLGLHKSAKLQLSPIDWFVPSEQEISQGQKMPQLSHEVGRARPAAAGCALPVESREVFQRLI